MYDFFFGNWAGIALLLSVFIIYWVANSLTSGYRNMQIFFWFCVTMASIECLQLISFFCRPSYLGNVPSFMVPLMVPFVLAWLAMIIYSIITWRRMKKVSMGANQKEEQKDNNQDQVNVNKWGYRPRS